LQITIARLSGLVGEDKVGTPQLLDSFRPDGFSLTAVDGVLNQPEPEDSALPVLRLSMRIFRPALQARVRVVDAVPQQVLAASVNGRVVESSGPWKTSGEWWTSAGWKREEWDVGLDDGALYRIYCEMPARAWYVHGIYD
jgi:protein ImuB